MFHGCNFMTFVYCSPSFITVKVILFTDSCLASSRLPTHFIFLTCDQVLFTIILCNDLMYSNVKNNSKDFQNCRITIPVQSALEVRNITNLADFYFFISCIYESTEIINYSGQSHIWTNAHQLTGF